MPATIFIPAAPTPRPMQVIRQIQGPFTASRCESRPMPRVTNVYAKMGLAYEKKVNGALAALAKKVGAKLETQVWFRFTDSLGRGQAVVDALLHLGDRTFVIEIKYTYTNDAVVKLNGLYVPIVASQQRTRVQPLVICKVLTPDALSCITSLRGAFSASARVPTLQWLGHGPIDF